MTPSLSASFLCSQSECFGAMSFHGSPWQIGYLETLRSKTFQVRRKVTSAVPSRDVSVVDNNAFSG